MELARELPSAVERLLAEHVPSVGSLELLLLLHREVGRRRTIAEVSAVLRCPRSWAEVQLERLREASLAEGDPERGYAFVHDGSRLARAVDRLARAYREDEAAVRRRIFASRPVPSSRRRGA